jgi:hypothetical protein
MVMPLTYAIVVESEARQGPIVSEITSNVAHEYI